MADVATGDRGGPRVCGLSFRPITSRSYRVDDDRKISEDWAAVDDDTAIFASQLGARSSLRTARRRPQCLPA